VFLAQLINFGIIFFLFRKFVADKLIVLMKKRHAELEKAYNAMHLFDEMVQVAEEEKRKMLTDALHQKDLLISEATQLAEKKQETILQEANKKAQFIATEAMQKVANLEKELED